MKEAPTRHSGWRRLGLVVTYPIESSGHFGWGHYFDFIGYEHDGEYVYYSDEQQRTTRQEAKIVVVAVRFAFFLVSALPSVDPLVCSIYYRPEESSLTTEDPSLSSSL